MINLFRSIPRANVFATLAVGAMLLEIGCAGGGGGEKPAPVAPSFQSITVTSAAGVNVPVPFSGTATLVANFSGGDCVVTPAFPGGTSNVVSGTTYNLGSITTSKSYSFTVSGPGGTASRTVSVDPQTPSITAISPSTVQANPGDVVQFTATASGTVTNHVAWSATEGTIDANGRWTAPAASNAPVVAAIKAYPADAPGFPPVSATATAYPGPSITAFGAVSPTVEHGGKVVVRATFTGGTGTLRRFGGETVTIQSGIDYTCETPSFGDESFTLSVKSPMDKTADSTLQVPLAPGTGSIVMDGCVPAPAGATADMMVTEGTEVPMRTVWTGQSGNTQTQYHVLVSRFSENFWYIYTTLASSAPNTVANTLYTPTGILDGTDSLGIGRARIEAISYVRNSVRAYVELVIIPKIKNVNVVFRSVGAGVPPMLTVSWAGGDFVPFYVTTATIDGHTYGNHPYEVAYHEAISTAKTVKVEIKGAGGEVYSQNVTINP